MIHQFKKQLNKNSTLGSTIPKSKQKASRFPQNSRNVDTFSSSKVNSPRNFTDARFNKIQAEENANILTPLELNGKQIVSEVHENTNPLEESNATYNQEQTPRFSRAGSQIFNRSMSSEHITMKREEFHRIISDLKNQKELSWGVHLHQIETLENTIKSIELDYQNLFKQIQYDHMKQIEEIQRENERKLHILRRQQESIVQKHKKSILSSRDDHQQIAEAVKHIKQQHAKQIEGLKSLHQITVEQANIKQKAQERQLKKQIEQLYRQNQKIKVEFSQASQQQKQLYESKMRNFSKKLQKYDLQALENALRQKEEKLKNAQRQVQDLIKQKEEMAVSFEDQINQTANFYHQKMQKDNQFSEMQIKQLEKKISIMREQHQRQIRLTKEKSQNQIEQLRRKIKELQSKKQLVPEMSKSASDHHLLMPAIQEKSTPKNMSRDANQKSHQNLVKRINERTTHESQEHQSQHSQKCKQLRLGQSIINSFESSRLLERKQTKIEQLEREVQGLRIQLDIQQLERKNLEDLSESQIKKLIDYDISHESMAKQIQRLKQQKLQISRQLKQSSKQRQNKGSCIQFLTPNQRNREQYVRNQDQILNTIETKKKSPVLSVPFISQFDKQIPERRSIHLGDQNYIFDTVNKQNQFRKTSHDIPAHKFPNLQMTRSKQLQRGNTNQLIQKYLYQIKKLEKDNLNYLQQIQSLENTNSTLRNKVLKRLDGFQNQKKMHNEIKDLKVQLQRSEHMNKALSLMNETKTITSFRQNRLKDSKEIPSLRKLTFSQAQGTGSTCERNNKRIHTVNQQNRINERQKGLKYSMIQTDQNGQRHRRNSSVSGSKANIYSQAQQYEQVGSKNQFNIQKFIKRLEVNSIVKSKIFNE